MKPDNYLKITSPLDADPTAGVFPFASADPASAREAHRAALEYVGAMPATARPLASCSVWSAHETCSQVPVIGVDIREEASAP